MNSNRRCSSAALLLAQLYSRNTLAIRHYGAHMMVSTASSSSSMGITNKPANEHGLQRTRMALLLGSAFCVV